MVNKLKYVMRTVGTRGLALVVLFSILIADGYTDVLLFKDLGQALTVRQALGYWFLSTTILLGCVVLLVLVYKMWKDSN